jgi:hypothetical protein
MTDLVCLTCSDPVEELSRAAARVWGSRFVHHLRPGVTAKSWDHEPRPVREGSSVASSTRDERGASGAEAPGSSPGPRYVTEAE